ncbi:MAG: MFS transporter [Chloroflexota bacterium]
MAATPTSTPAPEQPRISRFWPFRRVYYGWAVLSAALLSAFATVPTQGPIMGLFVKPITEDLGWSATSISVGFVLGSITGGGMSFGVGRILDKRGARGVSVVAGMLIAGSMIGLALMTAPWHFWVFFGLARGAAAAGAQLGTMVALASWFVRKRGRATGILGTGQRLGQAVLPLPILAIILTYGWRWGWVALAVLAVALVVVPSGMLMRRRPEDYGLRPDGAPSRAPRADGSAAPEEAEVQWTLAQAKRTRTLWALIVAQGGVVLGLNAVNLHITANFQEKIGDVQGAIVTTTFALVSALMTLPAGLLMERVHTRYLGLLATGLFIGAMCIAIVASTFPLGIAFGLTYGLGLGFWTVTSRMLFANYFGRSAFGSIRGFAAPIMTAVNPLGPVLAGLVKDSTGSYTIAFIAFGVVFGISFVAFVLATPLKAPEAPAPELAA